MVGESNCESRVLDIHKCVSLSSHGPVVDTSTERDASAAEQVAKDIGEGALVLLKLARLFVPFPPPPPFFPPCFLCFLLELDLSNNILSLLGMMSSRMLLNNCLAEYSMPDPAPAASSQAVRRLYILSVLHYI